VKIGDFGLSTILNPEMPEITRCGSPGYVAPEILNKEAYNTQADIFSLGVILYVMYYLLLYLDLLVHHLLLLILLNKFFSSTNNAI